MLPDLPPPPPLLVDPLPYELKLDARPLSQIDLVVIHCTETPTLASAREFGEKVLYEGSGTGNSGHYYIDRDGTIECWVPPERTAHHVRGHNADSIGVELVNEGRWPEWYHSQRQQPVEAYAVPQVDALVALLRWLRQVCPGLQGLAGHEDLDQEPVAASDDPTLTVRRKIDPGPLFPWSRVVAGSGLPRLATSLPPIRPPLP